ncbi:MAG: hypothetical protein ACXW4Z_20635 [Candidatus Binatia bacterium]
MKPHLALPIGMLLTGWFVLPASAQPLQKLRVGYPSISSRQGKAYVEGIYLVFANKAATVKTLAKYMRTNDAEVLDYSYQHYLKRTPKKPYPTMKGVQNLVDMSGPQVAQAKTAKPEQFVDLSLLQELENEKFFDEMAKRYR